MNRTRNTELTPEISTITRHKVHADHTQSDLIYEELNIKNSLKQVSVSHGYQRKVLSNIYPERQHYFIINLPDAHTINMALGCFNEL